MYGNTMYEMAKARIAEQERRASEAGEARRQRAEARSRRRRQRAADAPVPVIPDYAEELLEVAQSAVRAPREEAPHGRHARSGR
jgi:hypothetical protein